jgi:acetylornithine deacetylase/succinyl-diaminopimelate desuccinylase-like protein
LHLRSNAPALWRPQTAQLIELNLTAFMHLAENHRYCSAAAQAGATLYDRLCRLPFQGKDMRGLLLVLLVLLVAPLSCLAADLPDIDWQALEREALTHFRSILRIDTSSPPGNETQAARYLEAALSEAGIDSELYAFDPARASLVARVRGNGSKRPLLLMGHTDVVGADRARWSVDPFEALTKDGYIYGRGTLDDKDMVTASLMILLLLERHGVELDRDVIFLAESGEEGTPEFGIEYMTENHWDAIAAEYCLAEGGTTVSVDGDVRYVAVASTEKFAMRVRLIARGTAGHGSVPRTDNAIVALGRAVSRLGDWQPDVRLNSTTQAYFERLADISEPDDAQRYIRIASNPHDSEVLEYFAANEPQHYSLLLTSVVPTIINGGFRMNVIPSEAEAMIDIRALPDEDPQAFYGRLAEVIGDPNVEIEPQRIYRPRAPASPIDNEMFVALEAVTARMYPEATMMPTMLTGATDMSFVRAMGTPCYGLGPVRDEQDIAAGGGAHGDDERILEGSLIELIQFLWYTVGEVALTAD